MNWTWVVCRNKWFPMNNSHLSQSTFVPMNGCQPKLRCFFLLLLSLSIFHKWVSKISALTILFVLLIAFKHGIWITKQEVTNQNSVSPVTLLKWRQVSETGKIKWLCGYESLSHPIQCVQYDVPWGFCCGWPGRRHNCTSRGAEDRKKHKL